VIAKHWWFLIISILSIIFLGFFTNKYKQPELVVFSPLQEKDLPLLFKWFRQSHVARWWKEPSDYREFVKKFNLARLASNYVLPFVIYFKNNPIGYIQSYDAEKSYEGWWIKYGEQSPGTVGLDLFIGETDYLKKGCGTLILKKFIENLFEKPEVKKIIVDPNPKNIDAICCYEKVGFKKVKEIVKFEGTALLNEEVSLLMEIKKEGWLKNNERDS